MRIGIVGRKCGMTRVFTEDGVSIPVTVVEASPNHITQIKSWRRWLFCYSGHHWF